MLFSSLITLAIAGIAAYISVNIAEEIESLVVVIIAITCLFFSLVIAPMLIKILIIVALLLDKLKYFSNDSDIQIHRRAELKRKVNNK